MTDTPLRSPARPLAEAAALLLLDVPADQREAEIEAIVRHYDAELAARFPDRADERKKFILCFLIEIEEILDAMPAGGAVGSA